MWKAVDSGVPVSADARYWWFRLSGQSRLIKAGSYEIVPGTSPEALLDKLVRGEQALRSVTLVEGWNFRQVREALHTRRGRAGAIVARRARVYESAVWPRPRSVDEKSL